LTDWPVLTDWLIDVAAEDNLRPESIHSALLYVSLLLSALPIRRSKFQLLGAASLFLSAKIHETDESLPSLDHFVDLGAEAYSAEAMGAAEATLCSVLSFDLAAPTIWSFATLFLSLLPPPSSPSPSPSSSLSASLSPSPSSSLSASLSPSLSFLPLLSFVAELSLLRHSLVSQCPSLTGAAVFIHALPLDELKRERERERESGGGREREREREREYSAFDVWYLTGFVITGLDPLHPPLSLSLSLLADVQSSVGPTTDLAAVYLKHRLVLE
jgi:hypothetical protein